jgi:hypothetical protein
VTSIEALIQRLEDAGLGQDGVTIFAGAGPNLPTHGNGFFTIVETPGRTPIYTANEGPLTLRRPTFQITARASKYLVARNLAGGAMVALTMNDVQIGDRFFLSAVPNGDLFSLPNDGSGRVRVAFNLETTHR